MVWYEQLYMGEKAKKNRFAIIQDIRQKKPRKNIYLITPPSNEKNVLDIYPLHTLYQAYYENKEILIMGIAQGYQEALVLAGRIVDEMYQKTGDFRIERFLDTRSAGWREAFCGSAE